MLGIFKRTGKRRYCCMDAASSRKSKCALSLSIRGVLEGLKPLASTYTICHLVEYHLFLVETVNFFYLLFSVIDMASSVHQTFHMTMVHRKRKIKTVLSSH